MTDADLIALCVMEEAGGECDQGKAAVVRVIKNRIALKYESDGTVTGTVLRYDQFSWAWFAFVHGHYTRVADTLDQATSIANQKLMYAPKSALLHCSDIAQQVMAGTYSGPLYNALTDDTLMYVNPRISQPVWATKDKFVCTIQHHDFYRA